MNKNLYKEYCDLNKVPLFYTPMWLDMVAKNQWDYTCIKENNKIQAILPYVKRKNSLVMPFLTPFLGPYYTINRNKYYNQLSDEHKYYEELIKKLPDFDYFEQRFNHNISNWLSFYWNGFSQTTKYTYIIQDISDSDLIWNNLRENIRREIRKSIKKGIKIHFENTTNNLFEFSRKNIERQGIKIPYTKDFFNNLVSKCVINNCGKVLVAKHDNSIIGAVFIVYDNHTAYYLAGGVDQNYRTSGTMSLLLWEAINDMSRKVKSFDFEGSMLNGVERFFRSFGAKQIPYFEITKINSRKLKAKKILNEVKTILWK